MLAALAFWGCGEAPPPGAEEPIVTRTVEDGLTCTPEDLATGDWLCTGNFTYSLECFAQQASAACGEDTDPKTCTTYGTCQHEDFGVTRGVHEAVLPLGTKEGSCESHARGYMSTHADPSTWAGITWLWYIGSPPPGGEESMRAAGGGAQKAAGATQEFCYITFYGYPVGVATGTGPQCGTVESACTVACNNPQTCQVNGAWVTDAAQCGTLVGPCGPGSGAPLYDTCRAASHGVAPDAECGAGFVEGQAPGNATLAQVQAQAAAQWAASGSRGEPVYDAPITCSECRGAFSLTAQEVNRRVYATVAMSREDPRLHLLAGSAYFLARDNPTLTQAELTAGLNAISTALNVYPFNPEKDGSGPRVRTMIRILARAQPQLSTSTAPGKALRAHAQALLASMHNGLDLERGLATAHSMVERYGEVEAFTEDTWARLHDLAQGNVALAAALNGGGIGGGAGVHTTQSAAQMLASNPMGPMAGFILPRLAADGSLVTTEADARTFVQTASTTALHAIQQYSNMLDALNTAEQAYRASVALKKPQQRTLALAEEEAPEMALTSGAETPEAAALKTAITEAKARGTALKDQLNGVREGVTGGLGLVADLLKKDGDTEFAAEISKFSKALNTTLEAVAKYAESSVKIAEKVSTFLGLGVKGFQIVSGAIFTGQIIGAAIQLFSLLTNPAEPPIEKVILDEIFKLKELIVQLQGRMVSRFDRVDRKLNDIHRDMQDRFALVNWELGHVNQNVEEVQASLHALHTGLNRVDQNMYEYFTDTKNDPFELAAWSYLGWDTRHPTPMLYADFMAAENQFSKWGAVDARNSTILAGIDGRGANPDVSPADELSNHKLSYNINYLREFPVQLGLPLLSSERISSPKDWMAGAEAYAQLFEEQPALGAQMLSTRHSNLIAAGTQLDTALRTLGKPLFAGIHARYAADWTGMKSLIENAEMVWRHSPTRGLHGIDLWGGPDQEPGAHFLKPGDKGVVPCAGGQWPDYNGDGASDYVGVDPARLHQDALRPLVIADNLNLDGASIDLCGEGSWTVYHQAPTGFGNYYERGYRLVSTVYARYNYWDAAANAWKSERIAGLRITGGMDFTSIIHASNLPTHDPNTVHNPHEWMVKKWGASGGLPSYNFLFTPAFRTTIRNQVVNALKDEQRQFYGAIAARMHQAGDALQLQAKRMTGTRLLWQSYAALALPLSLDHDEHLRGLLYGEDGVLSGYDTAQDVEVTPVMNDLQDVYALFSNAAAPPATNILQDLHPAVTSRADRLKAALEASLDAQAEAGGPEASAWVEPTLLRLRLSVPN
ncbi:hypothetical protein [Comamonas sp. JC664]|uniref:hypothetical protein n=1 Tax=Comamonas sp. JC664 TaxID=2801917 RepID=UPI00191DAD2B|nr:hypothetical protein [Comamonas sp. JC664]MBL0698915.1 hypothetical protein [Comamonas sp. JC664]GHG79522.1 hypothetical protein GCM10012319_31470 [Comamonas sp. KCTC 72670]